MIVLTTFFFGLIAWTFVWENQSSREDFRVAVHQVLIVEGEKLSWSVAGHIVAVDGGLLLAN